MELTKKLERCILWITVAIVASAAADIIATISMMVHQWFLFPRH